MQTPPFRPSRGVAVGFTLVELCLGIAITGLVLAGLAAFTAAVGHGWRETESGGTLRRFTTTTTRRLKTEFQPAKYLLGTGTTSAGGRNSSTVHWVVYWRADDFAAIGLASTPSQVRANDGVMHLAEVAALEFDPARRTLVRYESMPGNLMTPEQVMHAAASVPPGTSPADLFRRIKNSPANVQGEGSSGDGLFYAIPVAGGAADAVGGTITPHRVRITDATFSITSVQDGLQTLGYGITTSVDGKARSLHGSVTLIDPRSPRSSPDLTPAPTPVAPVQEDEDD